MSDNKNDLNEYVDYGDIPGVTNASSSNPQGIDRPPFNGLKGEICKLTAETLSKLERTTDIPRVAKFEYISSFMREKNYDEDPEKFKELYPLPKRATHGSAGYDFFLHDDIVIHPNQTLKIDTHVKCRIDRDYVLQLYPKSGLGTKYGIRLCNTVGIIDSDYYNNEDNEGHIMAIIMNTGSEVLKLQRGKAIVQGLFVRYGITTDDDISKDAIRRGGFGSTSK